LDIERDRWVLLASETTPNIGLLRRRSNPIYEKCTSRAARDRELIQDSIKAEVVKATDDLFVTLNGVADPEAYLAVYIPRLGTHPIVYDPEGQRYAGVGKSLGEFTTLETPYFHLAPGSIAVLERIITKMADKV